MKFNKKTYTISAETLKLVTEALAANWFISDGEDEDNNYDVIEADKALTAEIEAQE